MIKIRFFLSFALKSWIYKEKREKNRRIAILEQLQICFRMAIFFCYYKNITP